MNYLIIVLGPTASGKTSLAIEIARYFNTEIISSDSRQFYKEMNIGTAKPTEEELSKVQHHFINNKSIQDSYSVGDYEREVIDFLENFYRSNNIAVMAGGTGLYINAVCHGLNEFPDVPMEVRSKLQNLFNQEGIEPLQIELEQLDPEYYKIVDIHNPQRLIRALEICRFTGNTFTHYREQSTAVQRNFKTIKIGIDWNREKLYERINTRVDLMLETGLVEEAKILYPNKVLNALQTVGYQELFKYFDEEIPYEEAVRLIKRNSRRYAKRQMTWFRKDKSIAYFKPVELNGVIPYLEEQLSK